MTLALVLAAAVILMPAPNRSREPGPGTPDVLVVAEMLSLGLGAGLNLQHALAWAGHHGHPTLRRSIRSLLRQARLHGLAAEMRCVDGPLAELLMPLARAVDTGAAFGPVVEAHVEQLTEQTRAEAAARAQRLPVKLLFPLALLMLPGLVLMVAGPALLDVFSRLSAIP